MQKKRKKEIKYDTFGQILSDSNPNFDFPFRFAGGLWDEDTKLVRFGVRDYDPEVGRWTSKEPLGFKGSRNFYVYAGNDGVNFVDLDGKLLRCTRALKGFPIQTGPFYHEYLCTSDGICVGLTSAEGFSLKTVKGRLTTSEEDRLDNGICRELDDSTCMDECLKDVKKNNMMSEVYNLYDYNCKDWAHDTYDYCTAQCGLYDMSNYYWKGKVTYEGAAWE